MSYLWNISVDSAIKKVMSSLLPPGTPNNFFFGNIPLCKENFLLYKRTHRRISLFENHFQQSSLLQAAHIMVGALLSQKLLALFNLSAKPKRAYPLLSCRNDMFLFVSIFHNIYWTWIFLSYNISCQQFPFPTIISSHPHHLCSLPDPPDLHLLFTKECAFKRLQPTNRKNRTQ